MLTFGFLVENYFVWLCNLKRPEELPFNLLQHFHVCDSVVTFKLA